MNLFDVLNIGLVEGSRCDELTSKVGTFSEVNGTHVKIKRDTEWFWVKVTHIEGDIITGVVDNELLFTCDHGLSYKDEITFNISEVCQVL